MSQKIKLALIYGGRSVEHDVSVISAINIQDNLDRGKFELFCFGIDKKGKWFLMPHISKSFKSGKKMKLSLDASDPVFETEGSPDKIGIDIAFVILHGTDGEDGSIQGLLKIMQIPVVGSGVLGSAIAMNKMVAKKLFLQEGVPTAKCIFLNKYQELESYLEISNQLGPTLIVKPTNLGSSVGVSKVRNEEEFKTAVAEAFQFDNSLLVEEFIEGRELECSILGNNSPIATPPGEVELNKKYEIYSFDAKYVDGDSCTLHIPADIPSESQEVVKEACIKAFQVLGCEGFARVDLFIKSDGTVYINEVNTLPGFTNISMYPKLCELLGISFTELISRLVELGLEKYAENKKLATEFISGLS